MESKIDELIKKISMLERELKREKELNREILQELAVIKSILSTTSAAYKASKKLDLLSRSLKAGPLAKDIVEVLIGRGPLNISQLTDLLKEYRGRASRRTVAKKLEELVELGVVEVVRGKKSEKRFKVRDEERK